TCRDLAPTTDLASVLTAERATGPEPTTDLAPVLTAERATAPTDLTPTGLERTTGPEPTGSLRAKSDSRLRRFASVNLTRIFHLSGCVS
ncbi:MAG: hypothetical protein LC723_06625, partial [Actinobacteria bacterium]|nr:hypothetical protein [Actinomycetota bacterium]